VGELDLRAQLGSGGGVVGAAAPLDVEKIRRSAKLSMCVALCVSIPCPGR
jgi:hypothetical protein